MGKKTEEKEGKVTIKVTEDFLDKFDNAIRYETGKVLEFDAERAEDVVKRGLAEFVEPELPQG
ncbi:hypothetical protein [Prevotella intermedia]|uniref:Uncharacterized protein n=1 Tax=Prevotella intermedia TaxID=28131 RepID=A0A2M8TUF0_PREIN|nr:hypothetical protein [Prevotella intermedia]PJI27576.1 hypothetical protein CTM58_05375 [Prevotella intermedia]